MAPLKLLLKGIKCSFVVALLFTYSPSSLAQDDIDAVRVYGTIEPEKGKSDKVQVNLYEENKLAEQLVTRKSGDYEFTMLANRFYTIEVIKEGYITKRLSFDTHVPEDFGETSTMEFPIKIFKETKNMAKADFDFPTVLVVYDEKSRHFDYVKSYSRDILKEQSKHLGYEYKASNYK